LIVVILTIVTQVGGLIWLFNTFIHKVSRQSTSKFLYLFTFSIAYLFCTILVIPQLAKLNGRTALPAYKSGGLRPHTYLTPLLNRHYVKPKLKVELFEIAKEMDEETPSLNISYLDANFPFINGFPLLPHLSHNDGKKIDLAFYYTHQNKAGNLKPANSGYGCYVEPKPGEVNQTQICKQKGFKFYDITKFVSLGEIGIDLQFDAENTAKLIRKIIAKRSTQKLFIEPHLKKRMKLNHPKVRFHGCYAVRHDDHIHYQIR